MEAICCMDWQGKKPYLVLEVEIAKRPFSVVLLMRENVAVLPLVNGCSRTQVIISYQSQYACRHRLSD